MKTEQHTKRKKPKHPAMIYLNRYMAMKIRRDDLREELEAIREKATRTTSNLTEEHVSGSGNHDSLANAAVKAVTVEKCLQNTIVHLEEALNVRLWLIEQLPDEWEKTVLTERYINGRSWESVLERLPFERTAMFEIHGNALQHFWANYQKFSKSAD